MKKDRNELLKKLTVALSAREKRKIELKEDERGEKIKEVHDI